MRSSLVLLLTLALATGCSARRTLKVTSDPPGALVRLDDVELGPTPVEVPFHYYGMRRVTFYKTGYQTFSEQIDLSAPWYARFPADLVSEVLLPFAWRDRRKLHVELIEGEGLMSQQSLQSVLERANILRRAGPEGPRDLPPPRAREVTPWQEEGERADGEDTP